MKEQDYIHRSSQKRVGCIQKRQSQIKDSRSSNRLTRLQTEGCVNVKKDLTQQQESKFKRSCIKQEEIHEENIRLRSQNDRLTKTNKSLVLEKRALNEKIQQLTQTNENLSNRLRESNRPDLLGLFKKIQAVDQKVKANHRQVRSRETMENNTLRSLSLSLP